jgi:CelD/BcsL family acetyltransferase involved in cellulose biosynthesis
MAVTVESSAPAGEVLSGGPEVLESLAPEWRQLCDEGVLSPDPFCRPEWSLAHAHAYEVKRNFLAVTARVDGRLRAVLPLIRERGFLWGVPVRILRRAVAEDTPRFDAALGSGAEAGAAMQALWRSLRDDSDWDVIQIDRVPASAALWSLMAEAEKEGFPTGFRHAFRTPVVSLAGLPDGGEEPWLARTSSHFRGELRRKTRRLEKLGQLRLERYDHATPEILERYYELERATWKGDRGCAVVSDSRRLRYYNEIARAAEESGYLSIFLLTLNDRPIAGVFGMTYGRKCYSVRCAFDPAFSQYSAGHIAVNMLLRDCATREVDEYDFLGEAHEWKCYWTSQTVEHGSCFIFRRGLFGRVLHDLKFRAVPLGRKLFRKPLPEY